MNLALTLNLGILAHFVGDYVLQSSWMANEKTKSHLPALCHVLTYGLVFALLVRPSLAALAVIVGTHFLIDRYRLARHVCWVKNWLAPLRIEETPGHRQVVSDWQRPWAECQKTGSPPGVPDFIAFWVMVIVDNTMHIACNTLALAFL